MTKKFKQELLNSLFALALGLAAVIFALFVVSRIDTGFKGKQETTQLETIKSNTEEIKKTLSPYEYKDNLSKVQILESFQNSAIGTQPTSTFEKQLIVSGKFKQGFLYIKASINDGPLGEKGDIYAKLSALFGGFSHKEFGGHLVQEKSLPVPKSSAYSEVLFNLSDIKYRESFRSNEIEITSADWLKLLNEGSEQKIIGFTSTTGSGIIMELSFYYECVEGSSCNIGIQL